jgi:hypothetical protein
MFFSKLSDVFIAESICSAGLIPQGFSKPLLTFVSSQTIWRIWLLSRNICSKRAREFFISTTQQLPRSLRADELEEGGAELQIIQLTYIVFVELVFLCMVACACEVFFLACAVLFISSTGKGGQVALNRPCWGHPLSHKGWEMCLCK